MSKNDVWKWETVAGYVSTFPDSEGEGACDVEVQIGQADGKWYLRTQDDAGGSDEAGDKAYATEDEAREAAEAYADEHDEGDGETVEEYLDGQLEETAARGRDKGGEWCVWWSTALDDAGPRERYDSEESARAAAKLADKRLHAAHPGGRLLCGHEVRQLVDGEWVES